MSRGVAPGYGLADCGHVGVSGVTDWRGPSCQVPLPGSPSMEVTSAAASVVLCFVAAPHGVLLVVPLSSKIDKFIDPSLRFS